MKLRRGFAIPTAAVIASAAVLAAAPLAAAAEGTPAPTATTGATAAPTATATATTAATPAATPTASATASATATATATATAKPSPTNTAPAPTGELTLPKITVKGFPTNVVPGAPAVEFSADVANVSGHESAVFPYLIVATEHNKITNAQIKLQYQDPDTKAWKDATPDTGTDKARVLDLGTDGFYINKGETLTFQLKLAVTADTEADNAASALGAAYIERDNEKVGFPASAVSPFTIGKAGTNAGGSTPVTLPDTKGKAPSAKDAVSKAKSKAGSRGGNLAETGGGSNTMPIALTGAAVVALGAGTLVFLRRRKAGAGA